MKVVLFCGGLGMRLRDHAENVPKPMVPIGYRPILWHLMRYYAHWGHTEFILCLGYRGDQIKKFFLNYEECVSNDFVLSRGGRRRELLNRDIDDWTITFVDTGLNSSIGERLRAVREHLEGEEVFLANYADGLTDLPLPEQLAHFEEHRRIASFLCVRPNLSYHHVAASQDGTVQRFIRIADSGLRVNGGFFVFRNEIFDHLHEGEDLVAEPFERLIERGGLLAYRYDGFWLAVDTAKDKKRVDDLHASGKAPWEVWRKKRAPEPPADNEEPARPGRQGSPRAVDPQEASAG
jgi:glucose-1-phosphate cytidylyltransferase